MLFRVFIRILGVVHCRNDQDTKRYIWYQESVFSYDKKKLPALNKHLDYLIPYSAGINEIYVHVCEQFKLFEIKVKRELQSFQVGVLRNYYNEQIRYQCSKANRVE